MICLWCLWYRSRFRRNAGWLHNFHKFFSRQFTPNGLSNFGWHFTAAEYTEKSRTRSISWQLHSRIGKIGQIMLRAAKHLKIYCLPRESSLNYSWPWWILPQVIRDIIISPRLSCLFSGTIARNRSIFPRAFTSTPKCLDIKNTIDCACLQSYIRQILPSSCYYKEWDAASLGLASNNWHFPSKILFSAKCSFFRQSLTRGDYQPTYQLPEEVYLIINFGEITFTSF